MKRLSNYVRCFAASFRLPPESACKGSIYSITNKIKLEILEFWRLNRDYRVAGAVGGWGLMIKIKGNGGGGCYPLWVVVWRTVSADAGGAGGGEEVVEHFGVVAYEEDVVVADALAEEVACGLVEVEAYLGAAEVFVVEVFLEVG